MADNNLIVVDEYYKEMGNYFDTMGKHLEDIGGQYLEALKRIRNEGLISGETAEALEAYITLSENLKDCASRMGKSVKTMMDTYVNVIDMKDRCIF